LWGGSIVPSALIQGKVKTVPGRCMMDIGFRGAGAWETLSKSSPVAALVVCLKRVSHNGEWRKPLVSGFMGRVPARFAMSPTQ
jgi:hypothetical protein